MVLSQPDDASVSTEIKTRVTSFSRQHPRVDVIFNVVSGTRDPQDDLEIIKSVLRQSFENIAVWETTPEKDGGILASEALEDGANVLIACGGDGTVTAVAAAIDSISSKMSEQSDSTDQNTNDIVAESSKSSDTKYKDPILAVIPRGTANAFCAALDIPSDVESAARMVANGSIRRIDFPTVTPPQNGIQSMMLLCGVGLEADTVRRADRGLKSAVGVLAYPLAGIASIWKQPSFKSDIILYDVEDTLGFAGGSTKSDKLTLSNMNLRGVTIANAAPATSVLAQGIGTLRPDDGLMEVVCISAQKPFQTIRTMFSLLKSGLMRSRSNRGTIYGLRARKIEVVCDPPQKIVIDGEEAGETPVTIQLERDSQSINVIAPKASVVNRRKRRLSRALGRLVRNIRGLVAFGITVALLNRNKARIQGLHNSNISFEPSAPSSSEICSGNSTITSCR